MNEYPELTIEAGSHTDSRASDAYNMKLSERRAKSTVKYIVSKGIDASRIIHKGYGETQLVNRCSNGVKCSKEEHQANVERSLKSPMTKVLNWYLQRINDKYYRR